MEPTEFFNESANRNIAMVMSLVEGLIGHDSRLPFIRKAILRRMNDIRRDGLIALEAITNSNTVCTSVSSADIRASHQVSIKGGSYV